MSTADIALVATAALAAIAAGASWASVFQNRKERIAASMPLMTIDVMVVADTETVRVHLTNSGGGVARGVEFSVSAPEVGLIAYGVSHPTPTFRPGESRLIDTAIHANRDNELIGFVSCYDATGEHLKAWWPNGDHRDYRIGRDRVSPSLLMQVAKPGFDIAQMTPVRYTTVERD